MKITANIDRTPEEARSFLGLPDVKPMQNEMMGEMRDRLMDAVQAMDPVELLRNWTPGTTGLEQMQDLFAMMTGTKRGK